MNNAIEIKSLRKDYEGFQLGPIDLELPSGSILGLVGENGAGKSSTIKLLLGMIRPSGGSALVLGQDPQTAPPSLREEIGVVLDEPGLPSKLNAAQLEKVMGGIYKSWDRAEFFRLLERLELPRDKEYGKFSRGMKMKLGIAIALSHAPRLLLLDEATSGLDPVVRDDVAQLLLDFARNEDHSVLISSHIISDLEKLCDSIAFIHKGRLMLVEDKDSLLSSYGIYNCSKEQADSIDKGLVLGRSDGPYGSKLLMKRSGIKGVQLEQIGIEDLFIYMVKEASK